MGAIKILHTADWHIGTFYGPDIAGENGRYIDICKALDQLCAYAEADKPDFILFSGDMFHSAKTWSDRGLKENQKAVEIIRRLVSVAPVVILRGTPNHDSEQQFESLKSTFSSDSRVMICTEPGVHTITNGSGKKIRIAALPGFDRGYFRAKNPGLSSEDENAIFTQYLKDLLIGMNVEKADCPTVLMAHYTVVGSNMESGQTALFEKYEPVLYPADLQTANYDLVCLGHIHRPQEISNCENAFYSGAIAQLNFNDESQKRGYYIHEINSETKKLRSEFKQISSREFVTLHFGDGDISDFNRNGDMLVLKDFYGKIVRVLYSCTDENNKILNKVLMEKRFYERGAYYVQEITPEKILVTANKAELKRDSSPEENLISYLDDKETPPKKIATLVEMARPIIAEATAAESGTGGAGTLTPIEITVHNYRNYRDETFCFDDVKFCTINGKNGVGKSSLFMDAIIDALFEEPREGDLTGWITNDESARSGSIQFIFSLGEKRYRVTRTRAKSGKATLNLSEFVNGDWEDRSKEKYRDTQAAITETLGMDSLTIKACALIMQDQYGMFLQADKEARMNVLGNILGLKAYETMELLASEKATEVNRQIRLTTDKINEKAANTPSVEDLNKELNALESERQKLQTALEEEREAAQSTSEIIAEQLNAAGRVIKTQSKIQTIDSTVSEKESAKLAQQTIIYSAEKVLSLSEKINSAVSEYKSLLEAEKGMLEKRAVYSANAQRVSKAKQDLSATELSILELRAKVDKADIDIAHSKKSLDREQELTEAHTEYLQILREIEEQKELKAESERLTAAYEAACKDEKQAIEMSEAAKDKWRSKIADIEKKVALLTTDCECIDIEKASCKFLKDALESEKLLPEYRRKISDIDAESKDTLEKFQNRRLKASKALEGKLYDHTKTTALEAKMNAPEVQEQERSYQELETVKANYSAQQERKELLEKSLNEAESRKSDLDVEIKTLETEIAAAGYDETACNNLRERISEAEIWARKKDELPLAEERKRTATARVEEITREIEALTDEKVELLADVERDKSLANDCERWQELMKKQKAEIEAHDSELSNVVMKIGAVNAKIKQADDTAVEIRELGQMLETYETVAAGYEELKRAFSQEGIPHNIVRSVIPTLEATASSILGQMSGGKMSVEIVTEKTLKSNSKKEVTTLDVVINDVNTGRLPYLSRSGGERVKAALSVILALSEIKSTKAGVQLGFLFIDEPPFLDAEGVQAYCDTLEAIQKRYSNLKVMAITHDPSMKARFPQSVDVIKTDAGSKIT